MRTPWFLFFCLLCSMAFSDVKRIYIACDDHTDYFWTADEKTYHDAFVRMLDYYLDLADRTRDEPHEFQSRFVCDGFYWLWVYQHEKSREEFERLIESIHSGHITVPMNTLSCCYGGTPMEAVLRSMYYAGTMQRRYALPFDLALSMENQTLPWGLTSLWVGCGAEYSWKGICKCATRIDDAGDREYEIYYWTGPDDQKILVKWNSMLKNNMSMGGYAEARDPWTVVPYAASDPAFRERYPYPIIGCFGKGWDDLETRNDEFILAAKVLTNKNQQVIVSNVIDFFKDFEEDYGSSLPEIRYSFGNEWELLYASLAETAAEVKRAIEKLRCAEAMAAIVKMRDPNFSLRPTIREQAFVDLGLFFEHCWTADGPVPEEERERWQRRMAASFSNYVNQLYEEAAAALAELIPADDTHTSFYVFNPLGWNRSDFADVDCSVDGSFHVIEQGVGKEVPFEWIEESGKRRLRIWAEDVPAVGYKIYEIVPGKGSGFPACGRIENNILENDRYRLHINSDGSIASWIDKRRLQYELAGRDGSLINQLGAAAGALRLESVGPVSITVRADVEEPLERTVRITLYREGERIDISNEITENFGALQSYTFGFNLAAPTAHHEEVGAIARVDYQSNGGQYADRCARYDWLTFNHYIDMTGNGDTGVTLSNWDGYYFRLGDSAVKTLDTSKAVVHALIGGQVDGNRLGFHNQGGDTYFLNRYALRSHKKYDPAAAMRFSLEHQNPLLGRMIKGGKDLLPKEAFSAMQITNPDVLLWAVKPAELDIGEGIVARLWNQSNKPQVTAVQIPSLRKAKVVSHLETDQSALPVERDGITVDFKPQQICTFRLILSDLN